MSTVSIIVPVYNVEKYIHRCIDSILNQSFSDFELILINDGSIDTSGSICDEYAKKDSRITVLHQENKGQASARNRALDIAKGEYICFVDSDDYIHPYMLEVLIKKVLSTNSDIGVCNAVKGKDSSYNWTTIKDKHSIYEGKDFVRQCLLNNEKYKCWVMWDKIYHKRCFNNVRFPVGRIFEDNAIIYKVLYNSSRVVDCDETLYYYYENNNSTMNKKFSVKNLDWLTVLEEMKEFFMENDEKDLYVYTNDRYLETLILYYQKSITELKDETVTKNIKKKLYEQYKSLKKNSKINIDSYPALYEILFPIKTKIYWYLKVFKQKMKGFVN